MSVATGLVAVAMLLGGDSAAIAQQTGAVTGTVRDAAGAALGFVEVRVEGTALGTLANAAGEYRIAGVPAGEYTVVAHHIGYRAASLPVTVSAGETATADFVLATDPLAMEAVVVTATSTPREKLESSTAITTMSAEQIEQAQPRSNADLFKNIPGFYVESSGGEVNNNLFVRGLPADGSYRYVVVMEDGIPAFDANDLFFLGADNLVRFDDNVSRMEAVRGGNSALFGSNAPGGLVNYISKTGGPKLSGTFKVGVGTDGFNRYDANVNGPLAENWKFSVGGYYRFDDGIRDPGFPAARGGQLRANITREFDNGYVRLFAKYINDRNIFYLPVPVKAQSTSEKSPQGAPVVELTSEFAPGFPDDGTLTTVQADRTRIPLPRGNGDFVMPLSDGIAALNGTSFMIDFGWDFPNDWSLRNTARVMDLHHENNAMPPGQALPESDVAQGLLDSTPGGQSVEFTFVDDGTPFDTPNGLIQNALLWHVERPVSNFSNQLLLNKLAVAGNSTHNITVGGYFGHYEADNFWMFNNLYTNIQNAPRLLNAVVLDDEGDVIRQVTDNGFTNYLGLFVNATGNATLVSFFAGDEWQVDDRWRIDLGARYEHDEYEQNVENTQPFDLGGPSDADDAVNWGNGTFTRRNPDFDEWAASVGINYLVSDEVSVYARGSRGYKMPLLDQYLFTDFPDTAETLWQAEGGVKVSTPTYGFSALGYWLQLQDFPSQDARIDPVTGEPVFVTALVGKARTLGFEFEGVWAPVPQVRINGLLTLQDHEYLDFVQGGVDLAGNWVRRIPQIFWKLGGSYSDQGFTVGGDWFWFGKRFSNNANTVKLPEFGYVNAFASYTIPGQAFTIEAGVTNLTESKGLTEGDPRFDESGAPVGFGNGRPILPRRWTLAVRYEF